MQALDADFYAFSAHKLYGPTGIGVLHAREALLEAMPPWQGGGDMIRTVTFAKSTWNDLPWKFEAGTPNMSGAVGLAAAMDYVDHLGLDAIAGHEHGLLELATHELTRIPGVQIVGTAANKAAVISFTMEGIHPHDIGTILDAEGVAIRTGHHCAMPVMDFFEIPATARASFACYSTREEVGKLVAAIRKFARCLADGAERSLPRVILDHNKRPRNFGQIENPDARADGHNPLCGDRLTVWLKLNGSRVEDVRFEGKGCAISTASASMMTEAIKGKDRAALDALFTKVHYSSHRAERRALPRPRQARCVGPVCANFRPA